MKITTNPAEMAKTAKELRSISETYTALYKNLFAKVQEMRAGWDSDGNIAFVDQINGFTDDLQKMALKFQTAADALDMQKQNYIDVDTSNATEVRKLIN